MAKSVSAKSYKLPSSKGRQIRIKKCPCAKVNGQPVVQRAFNAPPFQGHACEDCFEIVNFELIPNENIQSDKEGSIDAGASFDNDADGQDE